MLSRVAEEMFWMSRYVERAIAVARLVDVTWHLELDAGHPEWQDADFWTPLLGNDDEVGFLSPDAPIGRTPREVRHHLAFDTDNPSSLLSCIRGARTAARGVRESISSEMWEQINSLYFSLVDPQLAVQAEADPHTFYRRVREGAQFFQGLADCTLAHDEPWHFVNLGKYLERVDDVARILKLQAHLLVGSDSQSQGDLVRWLAVLRSCGCAEAYARHYSLRVDPARVIEFLLLNPIFPQSVRFSLGAAWESLAAIDSARGHDSSVMSPALRALGRLRSRIEYVAVDEVLEAGLRVYLTDVQLHVARISDLVTQSHLRDDVRPDRQVAVSRAAMIMAAQQQQ